MEIWKDIVGYEGVYQVSNLGNIRSLKFCKIKLIKPTINSGGYKTITLYLDGKRCTHSIHQLVAESFLGHIRCGYKFIIDHIDNDRLNNAVDNIRIATQRDNVHNKKGRKEGKYTSKYMGVHYDKTNNRWYSTLYYNKNKYYVGCFKTEIEAHNAYQDKLKEIISTYKKKIKELESNQ